MRPVSKRLNPFCVIDRLSTKALVRLLVFFVLLATWCLRVLIADAEGLRPCSEVDPPVTNANGTTRGEACSYNPPPPGLYPDTVQTAWGYDRTPTGITEYATYLNEPDTARVGVHVWTITTVDPLLHWGRVTTEDSINNVALGIVPAWKVPPGFDREAFMAATGCTDVRLVMTDTPRVDVETNELGYFTGYLLPAADHPITGELILCLTGGGHIVQVASFGPTGGAPLAPADELTAAVVAWLADAPAEPEDLATCEGADDGEFRVQVVEDC